MLRKTIIGLATMAMLLAAGCENPDTAKPTIDAFTINGADHEVEVAAGDTAVLQLSFSDNENLQTYKVDIHDGFDGHGHGKVNSFQKFSYQQTFSIAGKNALESRDVAIPEDAAAGPYHCTVRVLDEAGNEGDLAEIDLLIKNGGQAQVNITSPDFSDEVVVNTGNQLTLEGTVTDDVDIDEIFVTLAPEGDDHGKRAQESPLYEQDFDLPGSSDQTWNFSALNNSHPVNIPANAETGHYVLNVVVLDSDGNMTIWEGEVEVQ